MDSAAVETASASPPESYAFLNHSTSSVHNKLPPSVDDKPLARQKRKRTSPEDQATLEEAYKRDPKPDKAARHELVKQVALGEKEVQIWFQNRRQSSRRKSRPLLPHEVAQYQMSRASASGNRLSSSYGSEGLGHDQDEFKVEDSHRERSESPLNSHVLPHVHPLSPNHMPPPRSSSASYHQQSQDQAAKHAGGARLSGVQLHEYRSNVTSLEARHTPGSSLPVGYLANRRSAPSLRHSFSEVASLAMSFDTEPERRLKNCTSFVRLSMNAEGKAEIVTKDAQSPSPPRLYQTAMLSGIANSLTTAPSLPAPNTLKRTSSGRSRDSRSWEFWCDKESRSELENTAEKDASGSAAGAISLLRTSSGRNILGTIPSKRNSALSRPSISLKRSKLDHKRSSLQRSNTSTGRLQSRPGQQGHAAPKLKQSESAGMVYVKGNDSDKENWSPDPDATSGAHVDSRNSVRERSAREQGLGKPGMARQGTCNVQRAPSNREDQENADPEEDAELSSFMRGGRKSTEDDDLDCVQGLLSLSQGNWR